MGLVGKFTGSQEFLSGDVPRWSRKRLIWPKELAVLRYKAKQNWESRDSVFLKNDQTDENDVSLGPRCLSIL